jgi:DNA repair exonuclease SbcCD ATPase subunit
MADKTEQERDIDRLFAAPLAEFTGLRNALSSRLKKAGLDEDASKVKALAKPSITAWAVNQLYFEHRDLFDRLCTAGERLRNAQLSQMGGKPADMRSALDERRNALSALTGYALAALETSGHAATPEAERRINATLEAISVMSPGATERPGRLTQDLDPPGFDALSAWVPGSPATPKPSKVPPLKNSPRQQTDKTLLRQAQAALAAARKRVQKAEAALAQAEMLKRQTDKQLEHARAASDKANGRVQQNARETSEAKKALQQAEAAAARAIQEAESD